MLGNNTTHDIPAIVSQFCLACTVKVVEVRSFIDGDELLNSQSAAKTTLSQQST